MQKIDKGKIVRCFIAGLMFISLITIQGVNLREAHQFAFMLGVIALFAITISNIWISLFLGWTVFLFIFYKFNLGTIYLQNIFYGCVLYFVCKLAFKKEHIDFFIKAFIWLVAINALYAFVQLIGLDFIFYETRLNHQTGETELIKNFLPIGFMGASAFLGCLMAMAIPVVASRRTKWGLIGALALFLPLYLSKASLCVLAGMVGLLFVLFFRLPRKLWLTSVIVLCIAGAAYLIKVDRPMKARVIQWHRVLQDAVKCPVVGYGLDSFRNETKGKPYRYMNKMDTKQIKVGKVTTIDWWDNPHNLYISLFFEFGIIGLFLLGGYVRHLTLNFLRATKDPNTLALTGFCLVFFLVSFGHFPIFLARCAIFIIPVFALMEVTTQ